MSRHAEAGRSCGGRRVVIGIGNALRGDDGVGLRVVEHLRRRATADAELLTSSGDLTDLLAALEQAELAILVDAVRSGARPGTIVRFDVARSRLPAARDPGSSHGAALASAIEIARSQGRLPRRTVVFGVEADQAGLGRPLTPAVARAASHAATRITRELALASRPPRARER